MKHRFFPVLAFLILLAVSLPAAGETLDEYITCRFSVSPAVYTGPSDTYYRAGSGKAQYGSPGKARVYGEENGWLLIGYQTSSGQYRLGYIDAVPVRDRMTDVSGEIRELFFEYRPVTLTRACELTDDPVITRSPIDSLPAGQDCIYLAQLNGKWAYIELRTGAEWKRGFVPLDAVSGVDPAPAEPYFPAETENPWDWDSGAFSWEDVLPVPTPQPTAAPWNYMPPSASFSGVWAIANQRLVTRSGPSVLYAETGTYYLQARPVLVLAKHLDADSGVWWVKCRVEPDGSPALFVWTGVKRFYNQDWLLAQLPIE